MWKAVAHWNKYLGLNAILMKREYIFQSLKGNKNIFIKITTGYMKYIVKNISIVFKTHYSISNTKKQYVFLHDVEWNDYFVGNADNKKKIKNIYRFFYFFFKF